MEPLKELLAIAQKNVSDNPTLKGRTVHDVAMQYLDGLGDEVDEVAAEFKEKNAVYLTDELSDIIWDFFIVLKVCEKAGWIDGVEDVFAHALQKYQERSPALTEADDILWDKIKKEQKEKLSLMHQERYENK